MTSMSGASDHPVHFHGNFDGPRGRAHASAAECSRRPERYESIFTSCLVEFGKWPFPFGCCKFQFFKSRLLYDSTKDLMNPKTMRLCQRQVAFLVPDVSLLRSVVIQKQFCLNKMRHFSSGIRTAI